MVNAAEASMHPLLYLFCAVNFVIGTGAFVLPGVIGMVADGLGASVGATGQAMTVYGMSTALIVPFLLLATGAWNRRRVILLALSLFSAGCIACALAPNLTALMLGRALMGVGAAFTPVAAGVTLGITDPTRRGQALALVFLGMSLSYVIGLPAGAWIGAQWGWRAALGAAAALAVLTLALLWWRLPAELRSPGASFAGVGKLLMRADVLAVLALTLLYFTAIFVVFSYIGPVLQALVPMPASRLSWTLALFGVSGALGTLSGGAANDRFGARRAIGVQLAVMLLAMLLLPLTQGRWGWMMAVLVVWGVAGFGMMAPQQSRLAAMAPAQAPMLLSLNSSMLYLGTALGAAVGGAASAAVGFASLSWVGAVATALGLALLLLGPRARPAAVQALATGAAAPRS
jgi:DHA1 family inner membrane transport protein